MIQLRIKDWSKSYKNDLLTHWSLDQHDHIFADTNMLDDTHKHTRTHIRTHARTYTHWNLYKATLNV